MSDNVTPLFGDPERRPEAREHPAGQGGANFSGAIANAGETAGVADAPSDVDATVHSFPPLSEPVRQGETQKLMGETQVVMKYGAALLKGLYNNRNRLYTRPTYTYNGDPNDRRNYRISPVRAKTKFSGALTTPGTYRFHFKRDAQTRYVSKRRILMTTAVMALGLNTAMAPFLDGDQFTVKDLYQDVHSGIDHMINGDKLQ